MHDCLIDTLKLCTKDGIKMEKTVIITGGNRGIGRSVTSVFAKAGYNVVVGSRSDMDMAGIPADRIKLVEMDVREEAGHSKLVQTAIEMSDKIDCYINNAGFSEWRPIEKIDNNFFNNMIDVNLKGAFWGCKAAVGMMPDGGSIINMSSIASKRGSKHNSMYCASKFGMNGLTQSLAKELGHKNIRVNGICPVLIQTDGLMEALENEWAPAEGNAELFLTNFTAANCALGRLPSGKEVGQACLFLASDAASAITGQNINVDCGVFPQ